MKKFKEITIYWDWCHITIPKEVINDVHYSKVKYVNYKERTALKEEGFYMPHEVEEKNGQLILKDEVIQKCKGQKNLPNIIIAGYIRYEYSLYIDIKLEWCKNNRMLFGGSFTNKKDVTEDRILEESFYDSIKNGSDIWDFQFDNDEKLPVTYESFDGSLIMSNTFDVVTTTSCSVIIDIHPQNTRIYKKDDKKIIMQKSSEYIFD